MKKVTPMKTMYGFLFGALGVIAAVESLAQTSPQAEALIAIITDNRNDLSVRIDRLKELHTVDREHYIQVLTDLAESGDPNLAVHAVEQLINLIVMMAPHSAAQGNDGHAGQPAHDMSYVATVLATLRDQFDNPVEPARHAALLYLSSIEDDETLKRIEVALSERTMSAEEAFPYLIAGQGEQSIELIRGYAVSGKSDLADSAIAYLGTDLQQQSYVRENILSNEAIAPEMRGVALDTLSKYDSGFLGYATQPKIVEFALTFDGSGAVPRSGVEILNEALASDISQNPTRKDFYKTVLGRAVRNFEAMGKPDAGRMLNQEIIQHIK